MKLQIDKTDEFDLKEALIQIGTMLNELDNGKYELEIRKPRRTSKQNRALHLWFKWVAEALNEAHSYFGKEFIDKLYKAQIDIEWDARMVKEYLWRPLQIAMTKKRSSTRLTTKQMSNIIDYLQKNIPDKLGIVTEFPSLENAINNIKPYEVIK